MNKGKREQRNKKLIFILSIITIILSCIFIGIGLNKNNMNYLLAKRIPKLIAIVISGGAVAFSSIIFQTICRNRILTPSVLGLNSVYTFFQTVVAFVFGTTSFVMTNGNVNFILSLMGMLLVSAILYKLVFYKNTNSIMQMMLIGLILGTFFNSLTSFMQVLIDPNEYLTLQSKLIASFSNVNTDILLFAVVMLLGILPFIYDDLKLLDVMSLGNEHAINLGINYDKITKKILIVVVILTALSTALVGPVTFLGLIVVNVTYQLVQDYKHKYLISVCILISICSLVGGVILVEKVFSFNTTLSTIINFIGGVYFLYLLLKESKL